ncbi:MAG: M56 family metallopeptidase, partial [Bacteroidota bacterium]
MLPYFITSSLLLFLFALGYFVFQRQAPTLALRRRVLLLGLLGVALLPLLPSPTSFDLWGDQHPMEQIATWERDLAVDQLAEVPFEGLVVCADETMEEAIYALAEERQPFWRNPIELMLVIYGVGVLLFLIRMLGGLLRLGRLHRSSERTGDGKVRLLPGGTDAFTFGNTVYLSQTIYDSPEAEVILTHERAHAAQWHTFDALLAEAMRAAFWFHPMAWWLRVQVQLNLEYLADAAVLAAGYDKRDYQLSLVAHQQGVDFRTSLLPQFAAKGLKRRIQMMGFRAGSQVRSLVVMTTTNPAIT